MNRMDETGAACACICVVDDDAAVRCALAALFEACGYTCRMFDSGEALLAWQHLDEFDLAVFDLRLPGIDGFAVHAQLALLRSPLPVVFISGAVDADTRLRARGAGALALLSKPLDPEQLLELVDRALQDGGPAP